MAHWLFQFLTKDRFDFLDLAMFYLIWTELIPWARKKIQEFRGRAWKCPYCVKGKRFRAQISDPATLGRVKGSHIATFHPEEMK